MVELIVTLQKMPRWDYSKPYEERGEMFEKGERVILVNGERWGRTHVTSRGSQGAFHTFAQNYAADLETGGVVLTYQDKEGGRWRDHKVESGGRNYGKPEPAPIFDRVREKAQELVDKGILRDPKVAQADKDKLQKELAMARQRAEEKETAAFHERAAACIAHISFEDIAGRHDIQAGTSVDRLRKYNDLLLELRNETVDKIVAAMRWAQTQ